jgi:hypothetical protein
MKNGMARVVKYSSYTPSPEMQHIQHYDSHMHDHSYYYGLLEAATNLAQGQFRISGMKSTHALKHARMNRGPARATFFIDAGQTSI